MDNLLKVKDMFVSEDTANKEWTRRCIIASVWFILSLILGKRNKALFDKDSLFA